MNNNSFKNLIKSDFYKLSKSRTIIICPIIISLLILLNYIVTWSSISTLQGAEPELLNMFSIKSTLFQFSSQGLLPIFIAVSCSLFIGSDLSYGLTMNSIARGASREEYFGSKLIVTSTLTVFYTLLSFVVSLILTGFSFLVKDMPSGWDVFNGLEFGLIVRTLVLNIFVNLTACAFFSGITFICKKQSTALGVNLGLYIIFSFIITMVSILSTDVPWIEKAIEFTPYSLQSLAQSTALYSPSESALIALMPLVYAALGIVPSILIFRKSDIN